MGLERARGPGILAGFLLFGTLFSVGFRQAERVLEQVPLYEFDIQRDWLRMPDGVRLSVTYFRPRPRTAEEKFPVLFEFLPYRKDDQFYRRDYPLYSYFARRGYVLAKVDIRGTGSSEGRVPPREYSEVELQDAVEIIKQLSEAPWSNDRVGMWGISWGGFNAIQVAMRKPQGLKAILAIDASDDLYHDDVHYIDGIFHVDEYELSIDHDLGLPRSPSYDLDEDYFENRFDRYPWFFTYLRQQRDGEFWRENSLRWKYDSIEVPVYLIGGLLDGYRDSVPRMLENLKVPVKAVLGPWNHAFPDNGVPGPNYEWRHELVRWWDQWLKGTDTGILNEPDVAVFVRDSHPPDSGLEMTPGHWRYQDWPIPGTQFRDFYPDLSGRLLPHAEEPARHRLAYLSGPGGEAGFWWGEATADMRPADAFSLTYESEILEETLEIIGFPRVGLRASVDSALAHWIVRLEDVHPNGRVSLVTGGALNGSQRDSRLRPEPLVPGRSYSLGLDLHFTTWTFQPGHRIRIAVSNGLFPMFWPTPEPMTMELSVGSPETFLRLPVITVQKRKVPEFLPPEPRDERPDAVPLEGGEWPALPSLKLDPANGTTTADWRGESNYQIGDRRYFSYEETSYQTSARNPARSSFRGRAGHRVELPGRLLELTTWITLLSDQSDFHAELTREISENGVVVRRKTWQERFPRDFQ